MFVIREESLQDLVHTRREYKQLPNSSSIRFNEPSNTNSISSSDSQISSEQSTSDQENKPKKLVFIGGMKRKDESKRRSYDKYVLRYVWK